MSAEEVISCGQWVRLGVPSYFPPHENYGVGLRFGLVLRIFSLVLMSVALSVVNVSMMILPHIYFSLLFFSLFLFSLYLIYCSGH